MRSRRIFAYGTLQFPDIAAAVAGRRLPASAARLHGYARFQLKGEPYPGIVPRAGASVPGVVYEGVDGIVLDRLDEFEGEMYRREDVQVIVDDGVDGDGEGTPLAAQTYVIRPRWRSLLRPVDWDPDSFARHWHSAYVRADGDPPPAGKGS